MRISSNTNAAFTTFTTGIFCILLIPEMFREGMFMDGLLYGTLGFNLANGVGTFWFPSLSSTMMHTFHEHPPLAFGIQGVFYSIFGNAIYIEKIYSGLTAVATAAVMVGLWRRFSPNVAIKNLWWLPIILWITMPGIFWSYKNNMLENTMGLFSIFALYILVVSIDKPRMNAAFLILFSAGLICCSALTKGFPGLYPIGAFFLYFLVYRKDGYPFRRCFSETLLIAVFTAAIFGFILTFEPARESLQKYFDSQVMGSLQGKRVVVSSRWHIMGALLKQLYAGLGLLLICVVIYYRGTVGKFTGGHPALKSALFFVLIGLSASAPIMISPKQLSFYVVPALPFFAMSIALILSPIITDWTGRIKQNSTVPKIIAGIGILLIVTAAVLAIAKSDTPVRDRDMLADIGKIGAIVPPHSTVELSPGLAENWSLMAYFHRKHFISLDPSGQPHGYIILEQGEKVPAGFEKLEIGLAKFELWRRDQDQSSYH